MTKYQDLVFCHKCDALAMAILDESPLCSVCLMSAIVNTNGDPYLINKIRPLPTNGHPGKGTTELKGLAKVRDLIDVSHTEMKQTRSGPVS